MLEAYEKLAADELSKLCAALQITTNADIIPFMDNCMENYLLASVYNNFNDIILKVETDIDEEIKATNLSIRPYTSIKGLQMYLRSCLKHKLKKFNIIISEIFKLVNNPLYEYKVNFLLTELLTLSNNKTANYYTDQIFSKHIDWLINSNILIETLRSSREYFELLIINYISILSQLNKTIIAQQHRNPLLFLGKPLYSRFFPFNSQRLPIILNETVDVLFTNGRNLLTDKLILITNDLMMQISKAKKSLTSIEPGSYVEKFKDYEEKLSKFLPGKLNSRNFTINGEVYCSVIESIIEDIKRVCKDANQEITNILNDTLRKLNMSLIASEKAIDLFNNIGNGSVTAIEAGLRSEGIFTDLANCLKTLDNQKIKKELPKLEKLIKSSTHKTAMQTIASNKRKYTEKLMSELNIALEKLKSIIGGKSIELFLLLVVFYLTQNVQEDITITAKDFVKMINASELIPFNNEQLFHLFIEVHDLFFKISGQCTLLLDDKAILEVWSSACKFTTERLSQPSFLATSYWTNGYNQNLVLKI